MEDKRQGRLIPKIKICGLTSVQEAEWVAEERVDYAGIVMFYSKSRRNMTIKEAEELLPVLKAGRSSAGGPIRTTAVTVSPTAQQVDEIQAAGFDRIQIHGELSEEAFKMIRIPIIRAYNGLDGAAQDWMQNCGQVEAFLYDAGTPGSGRTFDWERLRQIPRNGKPLFLAGGLNAGNIGQAIREVRPDAVDVSSGVEKDRTDAAADGRTLVRIGKDRDKIRAFVDAVRKVTDAG